MPVINLPLDTRWGDLGKGVGALLGNVIQSVQQQKTDAGVSELMNDPAFANNPTGMLAAVAQKFPNGGVQSLTKLLDNRAKLAQIGLAGAETTRTANQGRLVGTQADLAQASEPLDLAKLKGELEGQKTTQALQTAEAQRALAAGGLLQAQTPGAVGESTVKQQEATAGLGGANVAAKGAAADLARSETSKNVAETSLLDQQIKITKNLFGPAVPTDPNSPAVLDNMIKSAIPDFTPEERAEVWNAAQGSKTPGAAASKAIQDIIKQRQQLELRKQMAPSDVRKTLDESARSLPAIQPFLQANSGAEGLVGGVKAWLTKKGIGDDPNVMSAAAASDYNLAHFVTTGGGLGGAYRIPLGKEVMPSMSHQPVFNVVSIEQFSQEMINRLEVQKQQLLRTPNVKDQAEVVQQQIDQYKQINQQAASLWWGYDNNTPGQAKGKLHYYYQGREVDQNLNPVGDIPLDLTKLYRVSNGSTHTGQDILDTARQAGLTPQAAIAKAGAQLLAGQ